MKKKELVELTDQELLDESKKMKSNSIINSVFIGFLIGIMIYSVVVNNWGFITLLILFLAYKLIKKPNDNKALEKLLKERNLK